MLANSSIQSVQTGFETLNLINPICQALHEEKYIPGPIWTIPAGRFDNKNESPLLAAKRELKEETGITVHLEHIKTIKVEKPNEFDAFYVGYSDILPDPKGNPEVDLFEFISFNDLTKEIRKDTRLFAPQLIKFLKCCGKDFKKRFQIYLSASVFIRFWGDQIYIIPIYHTNWFIFFFSFYI